MSGRWALFLSGRGSTAQSLLDQAGELDIRCVVSSKKSAPGVQRARRHGIPVIFLNKDFSWGDLRAELRRRGIDRILLVGFMRLLPADFVADWSGRIWNVHPSLLPSYPGADALKKSFDDKAPLGVSLHEVTAEMDAGDVLLRSPVARGSWDDVQLRVARVEQRLLRELAGRKNFRRIA